MVYELTLRMRLPEAKSEQECRNLGRLLVQSMNDNALIEFVVVGHEIKEK